MIPEHVRPFFADLGWQDVDLTSWPEYTIGRLLEFGDERAVAWMRENFPPESIRQVIRADRRLSRKSATFWALVYGVPADEVAALCHG